MSQQPVAPAVAPPPAELRPKKQGPKLAASQTRLAWAFLAPTLLIVTLVALYPLAQTFYLSLTDANLLTGESKYIGFENYRYLLLEDTIFRNTIKVTLIFTAMTVFFEFVLGLIIALVINSQFKGRGFMRAAMLIPWAIPTVISARMWAWMYNDVYGVINDLLFNKLGLVDQKIAFTGGTFWPAIISVAAIDIWKTTPFMALLLLAGLQVITPDVYEAAGVDGANKVQQFFRITLPLLRPAILVALIFRTLDALRVFDVFYALFGQRSDTQTMAIYAQQYLVSFSDLGYGSAICVMIFVIIAIFVAMYVSIFKMEEA